MKIIHAQELIRGTMELPVFSTAIILDSDEMFLAEVIILSILNQDIEDEYRTQLNSLYEQVRRPYPEEIH